MSTERNQDGAQDAVINILSTLLILAMSVFVAALGLYFFKFRGPLSDSQEVWGQFGDFVGGTLNPMLAFLSLIALVLTVSMQRRQLDISRAELKNSKAELEATRAELKRTADAQAEAARAMERQARTSATSTRLAALSASLTVIESMIRDSKLLGMPQDDEAVETLKNKRKELLSAIFEITGQQLHGAAA